MALRVPGQSLPPIVPGPTPQAPAPPTLPRVTTGPSLAAVPPPDLVKEVAREVAAVQRIEDTARVANQTTDLPNFANAVTCIYGISGSGKSSLADTAAEFAFEMFKGTTLCYLTDLGGFGTRRLSLIRLGIMRVYDPRNHTNPFETMELISLGAFPEYIDDPETGRAAPNVRLILPRRIVTTLTCPQGHAVARYDNPYELEAANIACPTCGVLTSKLNGSTQGQIVRHRMFKNVVHRIYDSLTEMNDWGMMRLGEMSAKGLLPRSENTGGSALGAADMLREGAVVYGGGSSPQVGFMQNRSYQWIANIRAIPDQMVPATCTFAVEQGKADDDSGGVPILGPQIAGNARTAKVPRWVGNCLHASREPDDFNNMRYRLWLTSHLDRRDVRNIPYLCKHRGIPLDMPDYLEDPWFDEKVKRDAAAWSVCSMKVFYTKLIEQLAKLEAIDRAKYPDAPALQAAQPDTGDEVISDVSAPAMLAPVGAAGVHAPIAGGQTLSARRGGLRVPGQVAPAPGPPPVVTTNAQTAATATAITVIPSIVEAASVPVPGGVPVGLVAGPTISGAGTAPSAIPPTAAPVHPVVPEIPSVLQQQLEASLEAQRAKQAPLPPVEPTAPTPAAPTGRLRSPGALRTPGVAVIVAPPTTTGTNARPVASSPPLPTATAPVVAPSFVPPAPPPRLPARRTPRPPV